MLMHNADLADTLGNLLHRAANLTERMCAGVVPDVSADVIFDVAQLRSSTDAAFRSFALQVRCAVRSHGDVQRMHVAQRAVYPCALQAACELAINVVKDTNKYLTDKAPWAMKGDARGQAVIVRSTLEALYVAAHFLAPFIPGAAETIFARLATPPQPIWKLRPGFDSLVVGTRVASGDILFAKFEARAPPPAAPAAVKKPSKPAAPAADAPVDVSRLDIRVGQVVKVWHCAGACARGALHSDCCPSCDTRVLTG